MGRGGCCEATVPRVSPACLGPQGTTDSPFNWLLEGEAGLQGGQENRLLQGRGGCVPSPGLPVGFGTTPSLDCPPGCGAECLCVTSHRQKGGGKKRPEGNCSEDAMCASLHYARN